MSECASTDAVQCYIEKDRFILTLDFLTGSVVVTNNMKTIIFDELKKTDADFLMSVKLSDVH